VPDRGSFDAADYVGSSYEDARARAEAAGWQVRKIGPDGVYTLDFRLDRLNLRVGPVDGPDDGPDDRGATVIDASLG
jgi:hypothetical protein